MTFYRMPSTCGRLCWGVAFVLLSILMLTPVRTVLGANTSRRQYTRPAITGIAHVTLCADDIPKSKRFYASLLGWEAVPAAGTGSSIRFYANHAQYVELISPPHTGQADRFDSVAFATSNAEVLRRYLSNKGIAVPDSVTVENDGSKDFLVRDPEGNKVEFTQQGSKRVPAPSTPGQRLSNHIMHTGYRVRNRAALDHFYKEVLGFHLYWQGGAKSGDVDWVMMQVPEGTDWIEYMLYLPTQPSRAQLGSANHIAPGVVSVSELQERLEQRGWRTQGGKNPQVLGVDGKLQLDLADPDGTRIEFMEFKPIEKPCCSPYTGHQPIASNAW
jgi:catechol 2,3-dioxygenase-like lactoylglutathione lyase family enzyme